MSKVADLKNALTELFRKGTEVGYTETEIDEFLEGIDYHTLLQAVWDSAETVYRLSWSPAGHPHRSSAKQVPLRFPRQLRLSEPRR